MKKNHRKIVLIAILTLVIVLSMSFTAIAFAEATGNTAPQETPTWYLWVLLAILIILNIVIILLLLLGKKDKNDSAAATEQSAEEPENAEQPVETVEETETPEETTEETPETTAEQPVVADETEDDDLPIVLPIIDGRRSTLDRSFTARLSQSDNDVKTAYSAIKNELLSYKKIRSRTSWKFEAFYKGRNKCVILQLRGKKLNMYMALNATELAPKYHAKDVSDKARYSSVPTLIKVSGSRSLLYAKQLIKLMMDNMGVEQGKYTIANYKPKYKSTKALLDEGLIKIKASNGRFGS